MTTKQDARLLVPEWVEFGEDQEHHGCWRLGARPATRTCLHDGTPASAPLPGSRVLLLERAMHP
jgi:hypothetical protein